MKEEQKGSQKKHRRHVHIGEDMMRREITTKYSH
jgi:hypothetical protein